MYIETLNWIRQRTGVNQIQKTLYFTGSIGLTLPELCDVLMCHAAQVNVDLPEGATFEKVIDEIVSNCK